MDTENCTACFISKAATAEAFDAAEAAAPLAQAAAEERCRWLRGIARDIRAVLASTPGWARDGGEERWKQSAQKGNRFGR